MEGILVILHQNAQISTRTGRERREKVSLFFFLSSSRASSPEPFWRRPAAGVLAAAFWAGHEEVQPPEQPLGLFFRPFSRRKEVIPKPRKISFLACVGLGKRMESSPAREAGEDPRGPVDPRLGDRPPKKNREIVNPSFWFFLKSLIEACMEEGRLGEGLRGATGAGMAAGSPSADPRVTL